MWGRVIEIMTAVWLALSPYIFRAQEDTSLVWIDCGLALLIATLASLSYWRPTRYAHLGTLLVATGMVVWGRFFFDMPPSPIHQNHIFVGFFLMMIAIIPNEASQPPEPWRNPVGPTC